MRVDATDQQAWLVDIEFCLHIGGNGPYYLTQAFAGNLSGYLLQGQVRRHQRHPGEVIGQHHHRRRTAAKRGDVLGMSLERVPRRGNNGLVHRRRNHGGKLSRQATLHRPLNACQHTVGIAHAGLAQFHRRRQRLAQVTKLPWLVRLDTCVGVIFSQIEVPAKPLRPVLQHVRVTYHDDLRPGFIPGAVQDNVRPDTCGLSQGQGQPG